VCECVCVCVRERERERESESVCECVSVCVCVSSHIRSTIVMFLLQLGSLFAAPQLGTINQ